MIGGAGNDTYVVDSASDIVTEGAGAGTGTDTIESSITISLSSYANVENITLTGTGGINATGDAGASDWHRIGMVYAEAGENAKAEPLLQKALAAEPKDDTGQAEVGAWYIRTGQREKGEELLTKAFARNPDELWHYVRTAEAFLNVSPK